MAGASTARISLSGNGKGRAPPPTPTAGSRSSPPGTSSQHGGRDRERGRAPVGGGPRTGSLNLKRSCSIGDIELDRGRNRGDNTQQTRQSDGASAFKQRRTGHKDGSAHRSGSNDGTAAGAGSPRDAEEDHLALATALEQSMSSMLTPQVTQIYKQQGPAMEALLALQLQMAKSNLAIMQAQATAAQAAQRQPSASGESACSCPLCHHAFQHRAMPM
jgi:hypothetical protein